MADVLVSTLVRTMIGNLNSLALREIEIARNMKTELQSLESTLTTIQAVLHDAEQKQWRSEAVKNWLRKLKDVAYDADDILDEFAAKALKWKARRSMDSQEVSDDHLFPSQTSAVFSFKKAHRLKRIRQRLDAVAEEKNKFHLTENVGDMVEGFSDREWRKTSSLVNESEIVGRHEDRENIVNELLSCRLRDGNEKGLSIYAIWGMGGLGKTTLTQLVYNDERVKRAFDLRIWVCVSDDFQVIRLTKAILESIDGSPSNIQELDPLQQHLQERLRGKRFLLVLDDVWSESYEKWDSLKMPLMCGGNGSMVLVTTRIEKVALTMATLPTYHLGYLSEDYSWLLFKQRAFPMEWEDDHMKLQRIGKEIVKKCGGVPLAVKALGSMLRLKHRESEWLAVKESEIWELWDDGSTILPALRLSYDNLPSYLRQCFAYCCIFPKDTEMDKSQLIELWMANGFVPARGQRELCEIGEEIFVELSWRSFFQDVKEHHDGTVTCKMHDLIHDLAISIMRFECYMFDYKKLSEFPEKIRHLHIPIRPCLRSPYERTVQAKEVHLIKSCSSLRSLILGGLYFISEYSSSSKHIRALDCHMTRLPKSLGSMIHLRYLNVSENPHISISIKSVPKSISNLVHLTYLNLSYSSIKRLPESTICLQKLQIMKLAHCRLLQELPKGMKHMRNLKCVDISSCNSLKQTPPEISSLTKLIELSIFIVQKDHGCGIGELKELDLGKQLCIKELGNVKGSTEARSANLIRKQNLESLSLIWGKHAGEFPDKEEEVLSSLQPHSNLKDLQICGYQGLRLPDWIIDVPNLVSVELDECKRCSQLPPLGKLPLLKSLKIRGMDAVKCISSEFYGDGTNPFPSLEKLSFDLMPNLETWKTVNQREDHLPRLQSLTFRKCPKLIELPKFSTLKNLQIWTRDYHFLFQEVDELGFLKIRDLSFLEVVPYGLLQNQTHLEELSIESMPNIKSLSNRLDNLSMLKKLFLSGCDKLEDIPEALQNLNALETLHLGGCHSLVSFPLNGLCGLTSLHNLRISWCDRFASLSSGIMNLTQLEHLYLDSCPMLNSLPEEIQHLNALQTLTITDCDGLTSVPDQIEHLSSLSRLNIAYCPNLMCLPQWIQSLTSLKILRIEGCPHLERRCSKDGGEDWPKIAHIPSIVIMPSREYDCGPRRSLGSHFTRFCELTSSLPRKLLKSKQDS